MRQHASSRRETRQEISRMRVVAAEDRCERLARKKRKTWKMHVEVRFQFQKVGATGMLSERDRNVNSGHKEASTVPKHKRQKPAPNSVTAPGNTLRVSPSILRRLLLRNE